MSTDARRIRRKRTKGWRMPEGAVYVGRPSKWGNPYRWQEYPSVVWWDGELTSVPPDTRRRYAVVDFKAALLYDGHLTGYPSPDEIRVALRGHDLACWCPLDSPCHGDVLLEVANR